MTNNMPVKVRRVRNARLKRFRNVLGLDQLPILTDVHEAPPPGATVASFSDGFSQSLNTLVRLKCLYFIMFDVSFRLFVHESFLSKLSIATLIR